MGPVSIKMYDKFGLILRIETTSDDVSLFRHYCEVEQRDGTRVVKWAPMKQGICSLPHLRISMGAANRRYLEFIWALEDRSAGIRHLRKRDRRARISKRPSLRRLESVCSASSASPR
jgi:hypothetical protein